MRKEAAFATIVGLVAISLGAGYLIETGDISHTQSTFISSPLTTVSNSSAAVSHVITFTSTNKNATTDQETSTPEPSGQCSSPIPEDPVPNLANESGVYNAHLLPNGQYRWLMFTMKPGGVATFCITVPAGHGSLVTSDLNAYALIVNVTLTPPQGYGYSYSHSKDVRITFNPASLNLTSLNSGAGPFAVTYTMTADSNAAGFYSLGYPGVCGLVPLAVTDSPQNMSTADFLGFFEPQTCPLFPPFEGWSQMTGFSGMSATWVTGPPP